MGLESILPQVATGAGVGGAVGGVPGAVIGGGLGLISGLGTLQSGDAAQAAAMAQYQAALDRARQAQSFGTDLMSNVQGLSAMSPQELQAYGSSLSASQLQLQNDAQLLGAIDPSIMESSKQALALLKGTDASVLSPIRAQRAAQRATLVSQLNEQYGAGAETSSAGIKALSQFDMDTASTLGSSQQSYLNMLLGYNTTARAQSNQDIGAGLAAGSAFGAASQRQAGDVLGAGTATLNAISGASTPIINNAGYGSVSQSVQGLGMTSFANNATNAGAMIGTAQTLRPQTPLGGLSAINPAAGFSPTPLTQPNFGSSWATPA